MKKIKIAIYSRKSMYTGKGDSIENQITLCKEFAEKHLDSIDEFLIYEDEGFSGGNIKRPEFQRLLKDVKQKKFKILICYRLDRISRNVADFSSTLELLQQNEISFISIKEQFDTGTPMGKAMVYISSVFAQLERETIAERVRDNMLQLAKTGRWLGGQCPLGFESERMVYIDSNYNERCLFKLTPIDKELEIIKLIFHIYYETGSVNKVIKYLLSHNIKGKNGGEFGFMSITDILRNPVYVISDQSVLDYLRKKGMQTCGDPNGNGILIYNKRNSKFKTRDVSEWIAAISKHKGIIPAHQWLFIQELLEKNIKKENPRQGTSKKTLLSGMLKCARCGAPMRVSYGRTKKNSSERIFYYICTMKSHSGKTRCDNPNVRGDYLENQIFEQFPKININLVIKELDKLRGNIKIHGEGASKIKILNDIDAKRKEMNSLTSKLSKVENQIAEEFIIEKITILGCEIKELEAKLRDLEIEDKKKEKLDLDSLFSNVSTNELNQIFYSLQSFKNKEEIIELKRFLLEKAVKRITIDGFTKEVVIELWGT